jgi:metal-dependent amidase/aminoacylase/carboxypeptidase family protein
VGLRADMDALPMTEHNTFAHASQHRARCTPAATTATPPCCWRGQAPGPHRNFDGTVYLIFQPAEEGGGGAREMIKDGLFEKFPDGGHLRHAQLARHGGGQFALRPGR